MYKRDSGTLCILEQNIRTKTLLRNIYIKNAQCAILTIRE